MKNNKKLVVLAGAAALGLVAATGVTSGFAWFAVNNTVNATSLTVKAKSNASYLLIGTTDNATVKTGSDIAVVANAGTAPEVYPAAFTTTEMNETIGGNSVTVRANKWYTGTISQRTTATGTWTSLKEIEESSGSQLKNTSYFAEYDFYLTLGAGSENYTNTIGVKATFGDDTDAAVKAAVLFGNAGQQILDSGNATHDYATQSLTATTSIKVEVYLFIDGTSAHVYSDYTSPITGDIDLEFKLGAYGA